MLGPGAGQLGAAYRTGGALQKAATPGKAAKGATPALPPGAPNGGKRNAYLGGEDDDTMIRALDRTERQLDAALGDEDARNAYGDGGLDGDPYDAYGGYGYAA